MNKDKNKWIEHVLYCKALLDSIHYGASSPFIPIYAIELGASPIEIGILYSLSNLSLNFFQVIWGYLSDRLIKYVMFIILGGFFSSITMAALLFVKSITVFIGLVTFHSMTASMSIPTFVAYSSRLISEDRWRRFIENINSLSYLGWVLATLAVGLSSLLGLSGFSIGFSIASISGITGSIITWIFCKELNVDPEEGYLPSIKTLRIRRCIKFLNFLVLSVSFGFFLSMAWPLFTITLTKISVLSLFDISILDIVFGLSGAAGLALIRDHLTLVKTSSILALSGSAMALIPLVYAFSPYLLSLVLIHGLIGVFGALYDAASLAYVLENTPIEGKGVYTALYNFSVGSAFFCGSLVAGYILEILQQSWSLEAALTTLYIVTAVGRFVIGLLYRYLD